MGRPTDYDPQFDYISAANEYLSTCGREQTKLPKIEEFCDQIGIDDDTAVEWQKKYPASNFSAAIKRIRQLQKNELIDDGLFGGKEVNPGMAIFLLKANHGMIETEKRILAGDGEKPVQFQIVAYDHSDPIQLPANAVHGADTSGSTPVPSSQLAPEGKKDNAGSEPADKARV